MAGLSKMLQNIYAPIDEPPKHAIKYIASCRQGPINTIKYAGSLCRAFDFYYGSLLNAMTNLFSKVLAMLCLSAHNLEHRQIKYVVPIAGPSKILEIMQVPIAAPPNNAIKYIGSYGRAFKNAAKSIGSYRWAS